MNISGTLGAAKADFGAIPPRSWPGGNKIETCLRPLLRQLLNSSEGIALSDCLKPGYLLAISYAPSFLSPPRFDYADNIQRD